MKKAHFVLYIIYLDINRKHNESKVYLLKTIIKAL